MSLLAKLGIVTVVALSSVYVYVTLRGPQGIPVLQGKWQEIRDLQVRNADLVRQIDVREDRLRRLRENPAEQQLEIRKRLKMVRPGDTVFIYPDGTRSDEEKKADAPPAHK